MLLRTEAQFSRHLAERLNKEHVRTTRIESHGTGNGIPDMFVDGHGLDTFLELKWNGKLYVEEDAKIKVAWRPGQVAWMLDYYKKHCAKSCLTVVGCSDGIYIIPMIKYYKDHVIENPQGVLYRELPFCMLARVLKAMSAYQNTGETYRECIIDFCDTHYPGVDYDPEVLWEQDELDEPVDYDKFNSNKLRLILTLEHSTGYRNH
jgi:hypothetical protein